MKRIPYCLIVFLTLFFVSCSNESIEEVINEEIVPPPPPPTPDPDLSTDPCNFNLEDIEVGKTVIMKCVMDLEGKTINLASGVNLDFDGGSIVNGTLNFSGGYIDGLLLNSKLELKGDVRLKDPTFKFIPSRWVDDIKQGEVNKATALKNNTNFDGLMFYTKELGATVFEVDEFDAYFEITTVTSTTSNQNFYPQIEAINIPGDFHLKMTDNTNLRVFPTVGKTSAALMSIHDVSNAIVSGGNLFGDRELRSYSKPNAEEGAILFVVRSGKNIVVDNVRLTLGSKSGMTINSIGFTFNPDYNPTENVVIKNCTFDKIRQQALSITDGNNITLDNNTFIDTGREMANSDGGVVGFSVNIEPVRKRDEATGELVWYQRVQDVILKNNKETGSRVGAFNVFIGERVTLENNTVESKMSWSLASDTKIRNNTFIASERTAGTPAISIGGRGETVFNNEISGNTISGYGLAISAYFGAVKIYDNIIKDNGSAIQLKEIVKPAEVSNNTITSSSSTSRGISLQLTHANQLNINNNTINVGRNHLYCVELNQKADDINNEVIIERNSFNSTAALTFSKTSGIVFRNNISQGRAQLIDASNVSMISNEITSTDGHGVSIRGVNTDIALTQNNISFPGNSRFECIKIENSTNQNEVSLTSNNCASR